MPFKPEQKKEHNKKMYIKNKEYFKEYSRRQNIYKKAFKECVGLLEAIDYDPCVCPHCGETKKNACPISITV